MMKLITEEKLADIVSSLRLEGKSIVFGSGVFDLLHIGHLKYLTEAKKLGDKLIVFVHTDASVKRMKGDSRPINDENKRVELITGLDVVDYVVMFDEENPIRVLTKFKPDVMVRSGEPKGKVKELVESFGGKAYYVNLIEGISSSKLIDDIKNG